MIDGYNWRVSRAELPLALRDVEATSSTWKLFSAHVDWFRYILLDNRNVGLVRHGGPAGLGLVCTRAASYELMRERLPGLAYGVSDGFWETLQRLGYTSLLTDAGFRYVVFGPLALVQSSDDAGVFFGRPGKGVSVSRMRFGGETFGEQGKVFADVDSPVLLMRLHGALRTAEERASAAPGKLRDGYKVGDAVEVCYTLRDEDEVVVLK